MKCVKPSKYSIFIVEQVREKTGPCFQCSYGNLKGLLWLDVFTDKLNTLFIWHSFLGNFPQVYVLKFLFEVSKALRDINYTITTIFYTIGVMHMLVNVV